MLQPCARVAWIVESEPNRTGTAVGKVRDDGVVRVHDERRLCREARHGRPPALGDELQLAVPIELVAKEIAESDDSRLRALERLRERSFVDFEQTELRAAAGDEGGCDPREQVRAGTVPRERTPLPEDLGGHGGRGGLPVGRRDDDDTVGKAGRECIDGTRIHLPEDLPRQRRAAAASDGT